MLRGVLFLCLALSSYARPSKEEVDIKNVITVPPNCPPGQELINGVCRDVWRSSQNIDASEDLEKPKCSPMEVRIDGKCISTLRSPTKVPKEIITVPPNCPPGQELVNGQCRDIWKTLVNGDANEMPINQYQDLILFANRIKRQSEEDNSFNKKVINVPNQCPNGYRPDSLGVCREIFD